MRKREQNKSDILGKLIAFGIPAIAFVGGMIYNGFTLAEKVATKPYVDERFIAAKVYTDEKSANTLKEAFEHSDSNRQNMALQMEQIRTELVQKQTETLTKVNMVYDEIQRRPARRSN